MTSPLLQPVAPNRWDTRTARHLLNRAGFGLPRAKALTLAELAPEDAVSSFVDFLAVPSHFRPPEFITYPTTTAAGLAVGLMDKERRRTIAQLLKDERPLNLRLRGWWLQRMAETPRPLEEKLALFWHGHFATSAQKVKSSYLNYHLNDVFRKYAAENVKELTLAVAQSPAMLRYLDNNRNVKGSPNENWARELMELFTMGPGHYTEADVKESARAFTGWSFNQHGFVFRQGRHDDGSKSFLGRRGNFDGYDIIDIIFDQPATAEFIVTKLWTYFAYESPERAIVTELAADLRQSNYELRPLLRKMFLSDAFYSDRAIGSRIKSPVECVLQCAADLGLQDPPYQYMAQMAANLGQNLLFPPNVKGWDGGRAWINANTLLQRCNLPPMIVAASVLQTIDPHTDDSEQAMMRVNGKIGPYVRQLLENAPPERARHYRLQLKDAAKEERRAILLEALMEFAPADVWRVDRAFAGLEQDSPSECIDALAGRLLSRPLSESQRTELIGVLAASDVAAESPVIQKLATLRLMMSLAEYQLV